LFFSDVVFSVAFFYLSDTQKPMRKPHTHTHRHTHTHTHTHTHLPTKCPTLSHVFLISINCAAIIHGLSSRATGVNRAVVNAEHFRLRVSNPLCAVLHSTPSLSLSYVSPPPSAQPLLEPPQLTMHCTH